MTGANILKANWGKACGSCGPGGGGDPDNRLRLAAVLLAVAGAIIGGTFLMDAAARRGTRILDAACRWDPAAQAYVVTLSVENTEDMAKLVDARVQARLRPNPGRRWPHPDMRRQYAAVSQRVMLAAEPGATVTQAVQFAIPEVDDCSCAATVWVGSVRRVREAPSPTVLEDVRSRM